MRPPPPPAAPPHPFHSATAHPHTTRKREIERGDPNHSNLLHIVIAPCLFRVILTESLLTAKVYCIFFPPFRRLPPHSIRPPLSLCLSLALSRPPCSALKSYLSVIRCLYWCVLRAPPSLSVIRNPPPTTTTDRSLPFSLPTAVFQWFLASFAFTSTAMDVAVNVSPRAYIYIYLVQFRSRCRRSLHCRHHSFCFGLSLWPSL